jgi:hypothetical protein
MLIVGEAVHVHHGNSLYFAHNLAVNPKAHYKIKSIKKKKTTSQIENTCFPTA